MRFTLFGCKDTSLFFLQWAANKGYEVDVVTIDPGKAKSQEVAGYVDISRFPELFSSITTLERYDLKSKEDQSRLNERGNLFAFSLGWQRLIPEAVLKSYPNGVFGMHGSAQDLPYGKGRSPLNWSIIEGRPSFTTNLFKYLPGVDNGPIVAKRRFSISSVDTAETLHFKNTLSMVSLVERYIDAIAQGTVRTSAQCAGTGSFYPKRSPADSRIDWNDSIENILRLTRAVYGPFGGAKALLGGELTTVHRAELFANEIEDHGFHDACYGMICAVFPNGKFIVRCNGGLLIVHEFDKGGVKEIRQGAKFETPTDLRRFKRNAHGYFDIPEEQNV